MLGRGTRGGNETSWTGFRDGDDNICCCHNEYNSLYDYFYDYENACGGTAYIYAKMSGGTYTNVASEDDAVAISAVSGSSGQVYSFTLDPMFDQVTVRKAGTGNRQ